MSTEFSYVVSKFLCFLFKLSKNKDVANCWNLGRPLSDKLRHMVMCCAAKKVMLNTSALF